MFMIVARIVAIVGIVAFAHTYEKKDSFETWLDEFEQRDAA